jgi:hypothetical protein
MLLVLVPAALWLRFDAPIDARSRDWTGGASYVVFWTAVVLIVRPQLSLVRGVLGVLVVTCCLEFLQLWRPPVLEVIRGTLAGRLILGTTFDWADFPAYFLGALLSWLLLRALSSFIGIK